jgi:hypothetical protein
MVEYLIYLHYSWFISPDKSYIAQTNFYIYTLHDDTCPAATLFNNTGNPT